MAKTEQVFHPEVTTTELWRDLEAVLMEKGASKEWCDYVMPDLQHAAFNYGNAMWVAGHKSGAAGYILPNPQD